MRAEILKVTGAKYKLGQVVATRGALAYAQHGVNLVHYLARHAAGDWGDLDDFDKKANDQALEDGTRLLSAYNTDLGRIWIITEADRSATTILLPEEY